MFNRLKNSTLAIIISFPASLGLSNAKDEYLHPHFSDWKEVPTIIESISKENFHSPLRKLETLTNVKLKQDIHQIKTPEDEIYLSETKAAWQHWWKTTGAPASTLKQTNAKVDTEALDLVWKFWDTDIPKPKKILPVWIPKTWRLSISFTNGDYGGREKELWIVEREKSKALFTKLRGDYSKGAWSVSLSRYNEFSVEQADQLLKAICYLNQYAPPFGTEMNNNEMPTYYAGAKLTLSSENMQPIWNTNHGEFMKSKVQYLKGSAGRSYYFLRTIFGQPEKWTPLTQASSNLLAPYRDYLEIQQPYLSPLDSEVVMALSQYGTSLERQSLVNWANKQQLAIDPNMDWRLYYGNLKVNIINFTRLNFADTVDQIQDMEKNFDHTKAQLDENMTLRSAVNQMLELKRQEEHADIMRHPQPLRDLIIADRHPDDSDLKHLKAEINKIRSNPKPKLFKQLIAEIDDGTVIMESLLNHIILDEDQIIGATPWGEKEHAIAINACIDALPIADRIGEADSLVEIILKASGGGKVEFTGIDDTFSVEVRHTKGGYSVTLCSADTPLSMQKAQAKLKQLYTQSTKK